MEAPSIGLLGFSQGGAMAHQLMRCAPHRFASCVSLAGFVVRDAQPGDAALSVVGNGDAGGKTGSSCPPRSG
ncbi:hypothetical protein [Lentzea sp. NBC_00516]|uniref:hypothetical protein n=1 Tax=Lentzea sp. NBC_00516 TaxID=2903582 RepID=UPI003FA54BC7